MEKALFVFTPTNLLLKHKSLTSPAVANVLQQTEDLWRGSIGKSSAEAFESFVKVLAAASAIVPPETKANTEGEESGASEVPEEQESAIHPENVDLIPFIAVVTSDGENAGEEGEEGEEEEAVAGSEGRSPAAMGKKQEIYKVFGPLTNKTKSLHVTLYATKEGSRLRASDFVASDGRPLADQFAEVFLPVFKGGVLEGGFGLSVLKDNLSWTSATTAVTKEGYSDYFTLFFNGSNELELVARLSILSLDGLLPIKKQNFFAAVSSPAQSEANMDEELDVMMDKRQQLTNKLAELDKKYEDAETEEEERAYLAERMRLNQEFQTATTSEGLQATSWGKAGHHLGTKSGAQRGRMITTDPANFMDTNANIVTKWLTRAKRKLFGAAGVGKTARAAERIQNLRAGALRAGITDGDRIRMFENAAKIFLAEQGSFERSGAVVTVKYLTIQLSTEFVGGYDPKEDQVMLLNDEIDNREFLILDVHLNAPIKYNFTKKRAVKFHVEVKDVQDQAFKGFTGDFTLAPLVRKTAKGRALPPPPPSIAEASTTESSEILPPPPISATAEDSSHLELVAFMNTKKREKSGAKGVTIAAFLKCRLTDTNVTITEFAFVDTDPAPKKEIESTE